MAPWGFTPPNKGTAPGLPFGKQKQHSGRRPAVTSSLQGLLLASRSGGGLCMPCIPIWGWKCRFRSISKVKRLAWQLHFRKAFVNVGNILGAKIYCSQAAQGTVWTVNQTEGLSWWQGSKSFTLSHHQICNNSPAAQAVMDTHWCTAGSRTWYSWQGSCGCSHHSCHTSWFFLNTQLYVSQKLTVTIEHSDLSPEENDSTFLSTSHKSKSDQSWEGVRICMLYSYLGSWHPVPANT